MDVEVSLILMRDLKQCIIVWNLTVRLRNLNVFYKFCFSGYSLSRLAKEFLHIELEKQINVRCSNWEADELNEEQVNFKFLSMSYICCHYALVHLELIKLNCIHFNVQGCRDVFMKAMFMCYINFYSLISFIYCKTNIPSQAHHYSFNGNNH